MSRGLPYRPQYGISLSHLIEKTVFVPIWEKVRTPPTRHFTISIVPRDVGIRHFLPEHLEQDFPFRWRTVDGKVLTNLLQSGIRIPHRTGKVETVRGGQIGRTGRKGTTITVVIHTILIWSDECNITLYWGNTRGYFTLLQFLRFFFGTSQLWYLSAEICFIISQKWKTPRAGCSRGVPVSWGTSGFLLKGTR